jgi:hypothetical protein
MKKLRFFIILCLFTSVVVAQENNFLLYSFKGNVSVVENKVETKAKVGKSLSNTATLKVPAGSAVTLICNEAAMFTLSKAGTYPLKSFGDSCQISSSSVSANYVKYVWAQMTKSTGSPGSNRKQFMNTVGAVSRSINNVWIDPRLDTVNYVTGDFPLSWKSYADAKDFEFVLYKDAPTGKPIYRNVVSKLKIAIPSFASQLKPGNTYYWTAYIKGEQNDEIKTLNAVSKDKFDEVLNGIKSSIGAYESEAEQTYRIAFMLEDAHFLADAYKYYTKAAQLKPDMPLYRSTLMSFKKDYEIK